MRRARCGSSVLIVLPPCEHYRTTPFEYRKSFRRLQGGKDHTYRSERGGECYTDSEMYARKLQAEIIVAGDRRPAPLDWLDSFCMRNFTGSAEFDDTLPTGEGRLEAGLRVDPARLAAAMSEWFTKRGKGNGQPVKVEILEAS